MMGEVERDEITTAPPHVEHAPLVPVEEHTSVTRKKLKCLTVHVQLFTKCAQFHSRRLLVRQFNSELLPRRSLNRLRRCFVAASSDDRTHVTICGNRFGRVVWLRCTQFVRVRDVLRDPVGSRVLRAFPVPTFNHCRVPAVNPVTDIAPTRDFETC